MELKEMQERVSDLWCQIAQMQEILEENGGELTPEVEGYQEAIEAARKVLTADGVDSLGRAIAQLDAQVDTIKAERDYLARQIKRKEGLMDFFKRLMAQAMDACEIDKVKGSHGYSITATTSTKTAVNKDVLTAKYLDKVRDAVKDVVPYWVTVDLKASATAAKGVCGDELPDEFTTTSVRTCTIRKPKASTTETND